MTPFPYRLTGPIGARATLGLIVLQTDETIEQDFRRLLPDPQTAVYISRVPSGAEVTPDTLATMEAALPHAASLLPSTAPFDVVGYACTSGTTLIGAARVEELVRGASNTQLVSNPLTAAQEALRAVGVGRIGIVSPYVSSVAGPIRAAFERAGFAVPDTLSFGEEVEARVARIDPASIREAALELGRSDELDAVFLSCTNLRTLDVIADLEATLGKPVVSSNQALAWHMARLARSPVAADAPGRLFQIA